MDTSSKSVLRGFGLGILLHLTIGIPVAFLCAGVFAARLGSDLGLSLDALIVWTYLAGLVQIPYLVPAILIARRRQQYDLAKGLAIFWAIAFTLSAACFGLNWLADRA